MGDVGFKKGVCLLTLCLVAAIVVAAGIGTVHIPSREIISIFIKHMGWPNLETTWPPSDEVIVLQIRLPRVLTAALVGAALSIAGTLFQGLLRNPMGDPYVIGTSGGAALGATVGLLLTSHVSVFGFGAIPALAFLGALG